MSTLKPLGIAQSELTAGLLKHTQSVDPKLRKYNLALSDDIKQTLLDSKCRKLFSVGTG